VNYGAFPKFHALLVCALSLLLAIAILIPESGEDSDGIADTVVQLEMPRTEPDAATPPAAADRDTAGSAPDIQPDTPRTRVTPASLRRLIPLRASETEAAVALLSARPDEESVVVPLRIAEEPDERVRSIKVRPGDSLSVIFKREGLSSRDIHELVNGDPLGKRLRNIYPGHEMKFTLAEDGSLLKLAYTPTALQTLEFEKVGSAFKGREIIVEPERTTAYKHGIIDQSLFLASQRVGLPDSLTMRLAQIFQWDIDFVLDIRRGDEFHLVYEELYLGEEFIGYGDILAAEFVNQGRSHRAIRYTDTDGHTEYYGPQGTSMRQAFIRAPVEFTRVSSEFNMRRVHPLFNRAAPHRGIDYAAPTGTPILAAGDGRIMTASRTEANGNYVVIQHGDKFTTKYLHMSKFGRGIKSGIKVRQGQVIGYVGATGWATGPHLHYEFLVNGVHQNPRTVKLPNSMPIPAKELPRFNDRAKPLLALLEDYKQQVQLALSH
jgi:murein DD-endopeptidase MepM/ murein hydrolase activator NlpD